MTVLFEPIVGRYLNVELDGQSCRIFVEEAGSGIPVLCLHTAGADSRQYRHLMTDQDITRNFRIIAFDLPWHGKSFPPAGYEDIEYQLTGKTYIHTILNMVEALELDRPVLMGCSMGGRIILNLAAQHADKFLALIGIECADHQTPWYDTDWLHRPDVHGGEISAAMISGLIAPQAPGEHRWETLWPYFHSGPGVFKGDLYFYREDSDYRALTQKIDTNKCPLFLLTGEYDYSCTPEDTLRTAERIDGAHVTIMENLGHFPMCENPEQFRKYLIPILNDILARRAS